MLDVLIIGGSNAGLSAALVLGRARRRVLLLDGGQPRNAPSPEVHSFLSRDGTPPAELRQIAHEQLRPYTTVSLQSDTARSARRDDDGFSVTTESGATHRARALLLATGVRDELPPLPGLAERWGRGAALPLLPRLGGARATPRRAGQRALGHAVRAYHSRLERQPDPADRRSRRAGR